MTPNAQTHFLASEKWLLILLTLLALGLRLWQLDSVPPGWRDDELINSLVISQKVLDGDLALYYPDASGHEALYHALNAIFLALFGPTVPGIRWLSAILGALAVPLTFLLGKRLFGPTVGWVAALGLTFSFWSLMYSRIGLRHILLPTLTLAAFFFFWQTVIGSKGAGEQRGKGEKRSLIANLHAPISALLLAALFVGLGFYTYFAGRGVPLILLAFMGYGWLMRRDLFRQCWRDWALLLGATFLLALPLVFTLQQQPEAEGRVAELAVPIIEARQGNFAPLFAYTRITLSMFHSTGDEEWLYNIPGRPLFNPLGAIFLWLGVLWAAWQSVGFQIWDLGLRFAARRTHHSAQTADNGKRPTDYQLPAAFLLIWWLAGIAPAFISVPPASLGHTILAQPATYLLVALPVWQMAMRDWKWKPISHYQFLIALFVGLLLMGSIALRDVPDYFVTWPERGMVRFLYRADIRDVALTLNEHEELVDFGISGLLAGPWDRLALEMGLAKATAVAPRWYNPERAIILNPPLSFAGHPNVPAAFGDWLTPVGPQAGGYLLGQINRTMPTNGAEAVCFANGLCLETAVYSHSPPHTLDLLWRVGGDLSLPPFTLISNPPPPGVYNGPRLTVFAQLWDGDGRFLTGDDGLWVDPYTLQPGDRFIQRHWLVPPQASQPAAIAIGLYDPLTGERILTEDGREVVRLEIGD